MSERKTIAPGDSITVVFDGGRFKGTLLQFDHHWIAVHDRYESRAFALSNVLYLKREL